MLHRWHNERMSRGQLQEMGDEDEDNMREGERVFPGGAYGREDDLRPNKAGD